MWNTQLTLRVALHPCSKLKLLAELGRACAYLVAFGGVSTWNIAAKVALLVLLVIELAPGAKQRFLALPQALQIRRELVVCV